MPRPNTGTYYECADGTTGIRYRLPDGTRKRRPGFKNKTEARKWHAENVLPAANGRRPVDAGQMTLRQLADRYTARQERIRETSTVDTVKERMKRPLEEFGDTRLVEFERMADDIAEWRLTLPPRYAPKVMGALRQVLAAGVRWGLLARNPAVDAGPNPEADPAPIRVYTLADLAAIADELSKPYQQLPAFGAATGLRPEEWSALERRHIDRGRRVIRIEQKNVDAKIVPGGKTRGSLREVPLSRRALVALDLMPPRIDTTLLWTAPGGGPLNLDNFRKREWAPAVEASGIEKPATPYDMRDTFASNALAARVTVFELAKIMGTSVRMIEKHYGALIDGAHAAITGRLDALEATLETEAEEASDGNP
jgi:integrase